MARHRDSNRNEIGTLSAAGLDAPRSKARRDESASSNLRIRSAFAAMVATAGIALAGCGGGAAYPANAQANFLNACEASGNSRVAYCDCALSQMEAHASLNTFEVAEKAIEAGDTNYPQWLVDAATTCESRE